MDDQGCNRSNMEDLTDKVEIIFHLQPENIDPRGSPSIQLGPVDADSGYLFKIPGVPSTKIPRQSNSFLKDEGASTAMEDNELGGGEQDVDDEWEETLIYVDLDDIPSVQELFAVRPDDFLLSQSKRDREEEPKSTKPTHQKLKLKFYNLDDKNPVLQIGDRFYMGKYEEPFGTELFFREKHEDFHDENTETEDPLQEKTGNFPPTTVLRSLLSDPDPPSHPVFGMQKNCTTEYELVAKVHKVLKMTRRNVLRRDEEATEKGRKGPLGGDDPQGSTTTHAETSDAEEPTLCVVDFDTQPPLTPDIQLPPGIVAHPISDEFVPNRTVDLSTESFSSSSMSWRLKQRNKSYLKGLDADDEVLKDGDNNADED